MPFTDPAFKTGFLAAVEHQLNAVLALDPVTIDRLGALAGSVIELNCLEPEFCCFVHIEDRHIRLAGYHEGPVDATFTGSAASFAVLAKSRSTAFSDVIGMTVRGQSSLITRLQCIHADMELDWEGLVFRLAGDVPGYFITQGVRLFGQQIRHGKEAFDQNFAEYLQEELKLIPGRIEIECFSDDVNRLSESVARLSEKVINKNPSVSDSNSHEREIPPTPSHENGGIFIEKKP